MRSRLERVEVRRKNLIELVMDGVPPAEVKSKVIANAARRERLRGLIDAVVLTPNHGEM